MKELRSTMKERIKYFFAMWGAFLALMLIQKPLFMLIEPAYGWRDASQLLSVMWHGLAMDLSMSAYLVAPIAIITILSVWIRPERLRRAITVYLWLAAAAVVLAAVTDGVLFPYWGFRLDSTPLFYFMTSPTSAMASAPWYAEVLAVLLVSVLTWVTVQGLKLIAHKINIKHEITPPGRRVVSTMVLTVLTALLIIPIRGGITVSTMSPGRCYFSDEMRLNYAAQNPLFTFVYSLAHADNLADQFRFSDDSEAQRLLDELYETTVLSDSTVHHLKLTTSRPDIYLIILESFSTHLMPSIGGDDTAVELDDIAHDGLLFTNFYSESFRTDRALPAILSAIPAQPTTSLLKYPNKFDRVPSLARALKDQAGYETRYYYGGDIDFTNLRGFLVSQHFDVITGDVDYDVSLRLSKWGVHDEYVFERAAKDATRHNVGAPRLSVIQTSSSHEPYDVPFSKLDDKKRNAFAYTDHCVGEFVRRLKASSAWDNALIIITADHWGSYPPDLTDYEDRHHIPLIFAGGALGGKHDQLATIGSQSAITGTIMALLGLDRDEFTWSRDLFDPESPQFAYMSEPSWYGIMSVSGLTAINVDTAEPQVNNGPDANRVNAYVQCLYHKLSTY